MNKIKIILTLLCFLSSSCSTYRSSFSYSSAQGVDCIMMDQVDSMITTGEIERFNKAKRSNRKYVASKKEIKALYK